MNYNMLVRYDFLECRRNGIRDLLPYRLFFNVILPDGMDFAEILKTNKFRLGTGWTDRSINHYNRIISRCPLLGKWKFIF